jgi:hypothetical protein
MKKILPYLFILLLVSSSFCAGPQLCTFEVFKETGSSHKITIKGSDVQVTYGAFDSLSLVGTKFILGPSDNPEKAVDFCEDRSAGGAGFQYTGFEFIEPGKMWTSNQAAGNSPGYQWGFHTKVDYLQSDTLAYIKGTEWLPAYYDAYNDKVGDPSAGESDFLYHLKRHVVAERTSDGSGGEIANLSFITKCKWKLDTSIQKSRKTDAFYFNRKVAKDHNMQVFLQGIDDMTKEKWFVGPIKIYEMWDKKDIKDKEGISRGSYHTTNLEGCGSFVDTNIKKVAFVMTIDSQKVAFGHQLTGGKGLAIRLDRAVYRSDPNNYKNGSFWYQIRYPLKVSPSFSKGEINKQEIEMKVGSPTQLENLGYWTQGYPTGISEDKTKIEFKLYKNYPNPFNPTTNIKFKLVRSSKVQIKIFNIKGETVRNKNYNTLEPGIHTYRFKANELPSGMYFYKLESENFNSVRKMLLIK